MDADDVPDDWRAAVLVASVVTFLVVGTTVAAVLWAATSVSAACATARRIARQHRP